MTNKKWTIRYATEDGGKYVYVIGMNPVKTIEYVCKTYGIDPTAIDYMSSEECVVIE
jgi:hypothetical protein